MKQEIKKECKLIEWLITILLMSIVWLLVLMSTKLLDIASDHEICGNKIDSIYISLTEFDMECVEY